MNSNIALVFGVIISMSLISGVMISSVSAKPHFSDKPEPVVEKNPDLSLTANFKALDLGDKAATLYLTSLASAQLECVNPGGNTPSPHVTLFEQIVNQSMKVKPDDGNIKRSLTLGPPTLPSASETCPNPNWSVDLLSLTYENVKLNIQRNNFNVLTFNFGNVTQR